MADSQPGPRWRNRGGRRLGGGAGRLGPNVPAAARERQCAEAKKMQKSEPRVAAHLRSPGAGLVWPRDDRARLRPRYRLWLPPDRPRDLRPRRGLRFPRRVLRAPRWRPGPREAARARRGAGRGPDRGRPADPHEWQGGPRGARRARLRRGPPAGDGPERGPLRRGLDEPPGRAGSAGKGGSPGTRRGRRGRRDALASNLARAPRPRRGGRSLKRLLAALALAGLVGAAALGAKRFALGPLDPDGEDQVFEVAPGES